MNSQQIKAKIEAFVQKQLPLEPRSLYDPVRAGIAYGGKRARPILTALCAGNSAESSDWLPAATAVELLHTFTLVHDDIMDNAAIRRGQPAIHVAFGMNEAILSGDVIVALAVESLSRCDEPGAMLAEFSTGFRGVCEGQALDKEFENRDDVTMDDYLTMIELKTSRVFELSAVLGAIAGGGKFIEEVRHFARELGLAFQIQDDLLDLTGNAEFGKTIGGDIIEGKRTALFVLAMQRYTECSEAECAMLDRLRDRRAAMDDVPPIRELFHRLGILDEISEMASGHAKKAIEYIVGIADMDMLENLLEYTRWILGPALADRAVTLASR